MPALVLVAFGFVSLGQESRGIIWAAALGVMGLACTANAFRCGRVHCYFTGPFFLGMAVVSLLYGMGALPIRGAGWNVLGAIVIAGALLLWWLPEAVFKRYRR